MTATTAIEQTITLHQPVAVRQPAANVPEPRWSIDAIEALFNLPFPELMYQAQTVHRENFDPTRIEFATLLSVKTGGCPEDCGYCPQAARYHTGVEASKLMEPAEVLAAAKLAQAAGATRFCMGAAWRSPKDRDIEKVAELIRTVKALGLETCATLGMLEDGHAQTLQSAGLDYYNHNLDSAPDFYGDIITTRDYQDRLDTLAPVGRPPANGRRHSGAVLSGRRQLDFLWRQVTDHRQPRHRSRCKPAGAAGHDTLGTRCQVSTQILESP